MTDTLRDWLRNEVAAVLRRKVAPPPLDGGTIAIRVVGTSERGYDPSWLRNAVDEPLDEAGVEKK